MRMRGFYFLLAFLPFTAAAETLSGRPSIIAEMDSAERSFYEQSFDYAMETLVDDQSHPWKTYSANGSFNASKRFQSNKGYYCRPFTEILHRGNRTARFTGYACRRQGDDGWCKIPQNGLLSCALEPPRDLWEHWMESAGDSKRETHNTARDYLNKASRWWPF